MGTYTTNYQLYMPTIGEQGWGELVNGNFTTIDVAMKSLSNNIATLETETTAIEERVTVLETGEFESVTGDVGIFKKIILPDNTEPSSLKIFEASYNTISYSAPGSIMITPNGWSLYSGVPSGTYYKLGLIVPTTNVTEISCTISCSNAESGSPSWSVRISYDGELITTVGAGTSTFTLPANITKALSIVFMPSSSAYFRPVCNLVFNGVTYYM